MEGGSFTDWIWLPYPSLPMSGVYALALKIAIKP